MGCCFSCCDDNKSLTDVTDERTRLLSDPVINSSSVQRVPSESCVPAYQHSLPTKTDEQSMLNKILQQTAINVIDISTLGPHLMEQNEYLERRTAYSEKLTSYNNHMWHFYRSQINVADIVNAPIPEELTTQDPTSGDDIFMSFCGTSRLAGSLHVITIQHSEDLVVPFNIPQKLTLPDSSHFQNESLLDEK